MKCHGRYWLFLHDLLLLCIISDSFKVSKLYYYTYCHSQLWGNVLLVIVSVSIRAIIDNEMRKLGHRESSDWTKKIFFKNGMSLIAYTFRIDLFLYNAFAENINNVWIGWLCWQYLVVLLASTSTKVDCVKLKNQIHVIIRTCNIEKRSRYYKKLVRNYKKNLLITTRIYIDLIELQM